MDYSRLITRRQYEKVAQSLGYKNASSIPFAELEGIAQQHAAKQRELYQRACQKNTVPHSSALADTFNAQADAGYVPCNECGGEGMIEVILGNSPYSDVVQCEVCSGEGEVEVQTVELRRAA